LAVLHEERFVDLPPAQIWAQVLDACPSPKLRPSAKRLICRL
jgi:hypothetical protein